MLKTRVGRYTLLRPLGAGGMAELFLARAEGIEGFTKLVALKRILPHRAANERFVRMFLAEARLVAGLDHQNIAHVHDIGQDCGEFFFTMEYVHGPDLRRILREAPRRRLQLENTLHVAIGLCAGLHHAHEARDENGASLEIVHRDVSPSNVLVSYQGAVKLVDFGVAKAATIISETQEGIIKGKYGYMSPEQCLGETLTRRSDVFNIGILLWEMTVGRRLYKINGDLVSLQRIVYVDAPRPSRYVDDYPPELERIVMRALARDPEKRYQTAQQLQLELESFALEHRIPVSPVSMALELRNLFRDRIDAWQAAQLAGRSLADHLAEISSDPEVHSSEEVDQDPIDPIDEVIGSLDTGVYDEPEPGRSTQAERPSRLASNVSSSASLRRVAEPISRSATPSITTNAPVSMTAPDSPAVPIAERPARRSGLVILGALLCILAGVAFAIVLVLPGPAIEHEPPGVPTVRVIATPPPTPVRPPDPAPASPAPAPTETPDDTTIDRDAPPKVVEPTPKPATRRPTKPVKPAIKKPAPRDDSDRAEQPTTAAKTEDVVAKPAIPQPAPEPPPSPKPGTIDPAGVRAVARAHLREIEACVARARMENRDLTGRVVLRVDVSPTGAVTNAALASSTGANATLEACMIRAVATWTFPTPAGGVKGAFTYPFAF